MTVETRIAARQILEIVPLVMRIVAAEVRRTGYALAPSHFCLLRMLARCPCNLSQLAERQAVSLPTMSNSIATLVERGWVKRTQVPHDRRAVLIELTPAGQAVLADVQRQVEARVTELLAPLSDADRDALVAGLAILRDAFAPAIQAEPISPLGEWTEEKFA
jgi:DNA-binding MarR family transcriptional regulator